MIKLLIRKSNSTEDYVGITEENISTRRSISKVEEKHM